MKTKFQSLIPIAGIFFIFLFCGLECNLNKEDPNNPPADDLCGPKDTKIQTWDNFDHLYDPQDYYLETKEGKAFYQFSVYVTDACHKKHAKVKCSIIYSNGDIKVFARADYQLFYQLWGEYFLNPDAPIWVAEIDVGMQDAFHDDQAAYFWGLIVFSIPDQGNADANTTYIRSYIEKFQIQCDFNKYKAPAV
jgi:hypothetical protein